jgi:hypothetical protein
MIEPNLSLSSGELEENKNADKIIQLIDKLMELKRDHDFYKTKHDTAYSMSDNNGGVIYFGKSVPQAP